MVWKLLPKKFVHKNIKKSLKTSKIGVKNKDNCAENQPNEVRSGRGVIQYYSHDFRRSHYK